MWSSDLIGRPVSDGGKPVGKIRFLTFHPETMRVMMVGVRKFFWNSDQVISWSSLSIQPTTITGTVIIPRPQRSSIGLLLTPLPVFTESGVFLGVETRENIDDLSGDLLQIDVKPAQKNETLIISRDMIISISDREIRVSDAVSRVEETQRKPLPFTAPSPALNKQL